MTPPYGEDPHHEAERVACNIEREALRKEVVRLRAALEKAYEARGDQGNVLDVIRAALGKEEE